MKAWTIGALVAILIAAVAYGEMPQTITYSDVLALERRGHAASIECLGNCSTELALANDDGSLFNHVTIDENGYTLVSVGSERPVNLAMIVFASDGAPTPSAPPEQQANRPRLDVILAIAGTLFFVATMSYAFGALARPPARPRPRTAYPRPLFPTTARRETPQHIATRMAETADRSDAMLTAAMAEFNAVVAHLERSLQEIRNEQ